MVINCKRKFCVFCCSCSNVLSSSDWVYKQSGNSATFIMLCGNIFAVKLKLWGKSVVVMSAEGKHLFPIVLSSRTHVRDLCSSRFLRFLTQGSDVLLRACPKNDTLFVISNACEISLCSRLTRFLTQGSEWQNRVLLSTGFAVNVASCIAKSDALRCTKSKMSQWHCKNRMKKTVLLSTTRPATILLIFYVLIII